MMGGNNKFLDSDSRKVRTYLDDVPEDEKEKISRVWGDAKQTTIIAAQERRIYTEIGDSFNRVVQFELEEGLYHMSTGMVSIHDISPDECDLGRVCSRLIDEIAAKEQKNSLTPLFASNACDWDAAYANETGAKDVFREAVIGHCLKNRIVLTGGESANLAGQLNRTGMGFMFTTLSRYEGENIENEDIQPTEMEERMAETYAHLPQNDCVEIVLIKGVPMIKVKKKTRFILTADGTGSKSRVCEYIDERTDIRCTLAGTGDDAERDGAFPLFTAIGVHSENDRGKEQILDNMKRAAADFHVPMIACAYQVSPDIHTYIMNGIMLSQVREKKKHRSITSGTPLVVLAEFQRTNGITTPINVFRETFGQEWYAVRAADALSDLKRRLGPQYDFFQLKEPDKTLGQFVAHPSTPYFRVSSLLSEELQESILLKINISSGGLFGKTRRSLEPRGMGADYTSLFESPDHITLVQMASRLPNPKGMIPDKAAYFTWGCGNGLVIATSEPGKVARHYMKNGIRAKYAGTVNYQPRISICSSALDALMRDDHYKEYTLIHRYTEKQSG